MNGKLFKGYFLTILSGLLLLAIIVFVTLQWDQKSHYNIYGSETQSMNTILFMLLSAIGGYVVAVLGGIMWRGIKALRAGSRQAEQHRAAERLKRLDQQERQQEKNQKQDPSH